MISIRLNGEKRQVPEGQTLLGLMSDLGLNQEEAPVAVALNLHVVPRASQEETRLSEGDRVDVVTAVGGG